jgi:hypothetical protein
MLGRDLRILATNSDANVPLTDEKGGPVIRTGDSKALADVLHQATQGNFSDKYDVVFSTYTQMQTIAGKDTARQRFLSEVTPLSVVIFDESHNAGGQGKTGGRSDFARHLVDKAQAVLYSSATYAKRPDVMDLYSKTDMMLAVDKKEDLSEAIAKGGVPMQQVVAAMLAKAGQYIRRERSFHDIAYETTPIKVDREQYDGISHALASILDFSRSIRGAVAAIDQQVKAQAQSVSSDGSTGGAGASSTNFTAVMHNLINQMLLSMKAKPAAQMAIEAIRNGEKPVITVSSTMESFLSDYAGQMGHKIGDAVDIDFSRVLNKYLDRTRTITIKQPFSSQPGIRHYMTDEELGPSGRAAYDSAKELIAALNLTDLPVSPIDAIKSAIEKAGYKVGEITGRGLILDYGGDEPILRSRGTKETSIRGRLETIGKFNHHNGTNGGYDALVINQAGSTGLSLHASHTFKDQRPRAMFVAQPEGNIDTHMQLLGRINRTGQVVKPRYAQLVAEIPAEKRPAASSLRQH